MNQLLYSPEALRDLDEIWAYIAEELQNPSAAGKTVDKILDSIGKLHDYSEIGPRLSSITKVESDYRYLVCGKYLTFYHVNDEQVKIDRILYGKRDYLHILFGEQLDNADE